MKTRSKNFLISDELPWITPDEGLKRQIMGYDDQIMMAKVMFEKDSIGKIHEHFHSQCSYVVSGVFEVEINGEKKILKAGDGFYIEPDAIHGCVCLEEGVLIDVFSPMRHDFIKK